MPSEARISEDQLWLESVKSWTAELSRDAPPRRQADLYTVAIAVSSELTLANEAAPLGQRFYSFVLLLLLWGTMRCDDLQNVDPASLELSQLGLRFVLRRTKTSGPGKPVGELQGFIARDVSLSGVDWLRLGMELLEDEELNFPRDFFAIGFAREWNNPERSFLELEGLATMLRKLLLTLPAVGRRIGGLTLNQGTMLISPEMGSFWTGHSARHTLPSWAAAAGIGKEDRDYLGRWSYAKHGSQDYVLTSRQVVHRIQRAVCKFILEGLPQPGLVEEELMERIKTAPETESFEPQDPDVLPEAPYFITICRKTHFRRLHVSKSCAVRQERCLVTQPVFSLSGDVADAVCKLCKPKLTEGQQGPDSSSSSSSSS